MAEGGFDLLGMRARDRERRALVAQRNALAQQADPNFVPQEPRSGMSRLGAFLQNIPASLIGTPVAETELTPFSGAAPEGGDQQTLEPLSQAILSAQSTEDMLAIMQRPDLFPSPPQGRILDADQRVEGSGVSSEQFMTPKFETSAENARPFLVRPTGATPLTGTRSTVTTKPGEITERDGVTMRGEPRLTNVPEGSRLATTPASGATTVALEGREKAASKSIGEQVVEGLDASVQKATVKSMEESAMNASARREGLLGVQRLVSDHMELLRAPAFLKHKYRKAKDWLGQLSPEEAEQVQLVSKIRRRVNQEVVLLTKFISGAQVSDKEREYIKTITVSDNDSPEELMGKLEDGILMTDFQLARMNIWESKGRKGKPWMIQNSTVNEVLETEVVKAGTIMMQANPGLSKEDALRDAEDLVERTYGISPGGFTNMIEEFDRGAPNFGR